MIVALSLCKVVGVSVRLVDRDLHLKLLLVKRKILYENNTAFNFWEKKARTNID